MADEIARTSLVDKLGAALPIALTAIATAFAGMSTSEMSRAMYWRTAAQDQSKAGSQWNLAGLKRDRSMNSENTATLLRASAGYRPANRVDPTAMPPIVEQVRMWMQSPETATPPIEDEAIRAVLKGIQLDESEQDVAKLAGKVDHDHLEQSLNKARKQAKSVESVWDAEIEKVKKNTRDAAMLAATAPTDDAEARFRASAVHAAQFDVDAVRYRAESTMNYWVGFLYEVRVKTSTYRSDRHRDRSENFFFAMLAAQIGAVIASLALARKRMSGLWLMAGLAGLVAVTFGGYVYLAR